MPSVRTMKIAFECDSSRCGSRVEPGSRVVGIRFAPVGNRKPKADSVTGAPPELMASMETHHSPTWMSFANQALATSTRTLGLPGRAGQIVTTMPRTPQPTPASVQNILGSTRRILT